MRGRKGFGRPGCKVAGRDGALSDRGMTMVEVLVALVILLFVSLALMSTALVSIEQNTKNRLRDEAVRIAEGQMETIRQAKYSSMANSIAIVNVPVRNRDYPFVVNSTVAYLPQAARIAVDVSWQWKNVDVPSHTISTIRREP